MNGRRKTKFFILSSAYKNLGDRTLDTQVLTARVIYAFFLFFFIALLVHAAWTRDTRPHPVKTDSRTYAHLPGDPLAPLSETQRGVLKRWLAAHPIYQVISSDYCDCAKDGHYEHPYVAVGDFNGDGLGDFAALVELLEGNSGPTMFLVFNGSTKGSGETPALALGGWMAADILGGASEPAASASLFIGPPETDNGYSVKWKGGGYELEYEGNVG